MECTATQIAESTGRRLLSNHSAGSNLTATLLTALSDAVAEPFSSESNVLAVLQSLSNVINTASLTSSQLLTSAAIFGEAVEGLNSVGTLGASTG